MTLRNILGQKLEVGNPVVLVTQGQGFAYMNVGRIVKFSRQGLPRVQYITRNGRYNGNNVDVSPPIQRYERLFVMTEEQYKDIEDIQRIKSEYDSTFLLYTSPSRGPVYQAPHDKHDRWEEYKNGLNAAMLAAGKEKYYD